MRRIKDEIKVPTFAYPVSFEYAMLKAAAINRSHEIDEVMMESLLTFKPASEDGILTYFAIDAAKKFTQRHGVSSDFQNSRQSPYIHDTPIDHCHA